MTLQDTMDKENKANIRASKMPGHLLMLSVKQAIRRNGIHCGLTSCVQLLKGGTSSIMFCLLPAGTDQLSVQIHHTLIKAFCHEKGIPVIQFIDGSQLAALINRATKRGKLGKVKGDPGDMNCVLIQGPGKSVSKYDKELIEYCNRCMESGIPVPLVDIPA